MAAELICGPKFGSFLTTTIIPITAYATMTTCMVIAASYMLGRMLSNPKLTLWSKTEIVQLFVSLASTLLIIMVVGSFCNVNMSEVAQIFGASGSGNIYDAAKGYLSGAALHAHHAITVVRYQLQGYTVLSYFNALKCEYQMGDSTGLGCFFGQGSTTMQPLGGYGTVMAALNFALNSSLMSFFTAMNFAFILMFVYRGFAFMFLPLGIFMRSMPYMRPFGSLMIAVSFSFLIVYPLMLAIFGLMSDVILKEPVDMSKYHEKAYPDHEGAEELATSMAGEAYVHDMYFGDGQDNYVGALNFAATAFIGGVFFPTVAMIAAIASVAYVARLYGDEIDLSRLTQLV